VLNLDESARMNVPGVAQGNWGWRFRAEQLTEARLQELRELTEAAGRMGTLPA
jgi:4-alpha-glucanotransferase